MKNVFNRAWKSVDKYFKITERGSTFTRELVGGLVVFVAMIYILPVNTSILSAAGIPAGAVFAATAICSGICTLLMGLVARFPVALSAGMGVNAFFTFTVVKQLNYTYQEALAVVFIAGLLFFILTLFKLRQTIINAIPRSIKLAISAGLGGFICLVGLKGSGLIVANSSTLVALGSLRDPWVLLALFGILLSLGFLAIPNAKLRRFAIPISMSIVAIIGSVLHYGFNIEGMPSFDFSSTNNISDLGLVFGSCFEAIPTILAKPATYGVIFSFIFVNLFDTTATLVAVGKDAGIMDADGNMKGSKVVMLADATGALIAPIFGTSPVTVFAESTVGIESGARTGLSAIFTSILFFISIAAYPLFSIFSGVQVGAESFTPVTSLALVAVGALMFMNLKDIEWDDKTVVFSTFITFIMMVLTYSVSSGLAFGLIVYVLMKICSGEAKKVSWVLYALAFVFAANFVVTEVINSMQGTQFISINIPLLFEAPRLYSLGV